MTTKTKKPTKVQLRILRRMKREGLLIRWGGAMTTPSLCRLVSDDEARLRFDWPSVPDDFEGDNWTYNQLRWNTYCALTDSPWVERVPEEITDRLYREFTTVDRHGDKNENDLALVEYRSFDSHPTLYRISEAGREVI